jgi:tRNA pseudouridine65 synthase
MLTILHQDDHLVAIAKPAGLLVHRTGLDAGETRFALQMLRDQINRPVWPAHRLDKGTSGVLLFALDAGTARALGQAFESGDGMRKQYLAVVRGWPEAAGSIDHPLRRLDDDLRGHRKTQADDIDRATPERTEVQDALTHYRTLAHYELPVAQGRYAQTRCALMQLEPHTGRRHQLRRHLKHIAHPIIGDATHGKGPLNRALADFIGQQRLWLHAAELSLRHPITGAALEIKAPCDATWQLWSRWGVTGEPSG